MANATVVINGTEYQVPDSFSDLTLNDYLRTNLFLSGTKVFCREGGCGACVVYVEYPDPTGKNETIQRAINSCLCPVLSCDGWSVTTVEGIGNQKQPHPIQKTLADHYGTQCGFCTPGMVMNMFGLMKKFSGKDLTPKVIEDSFDGNLCRCTGYRPVLEAFKSLAPKGEACTTADIEETLGKLCSKTGKLCGGHCENRHLAVPSPNPAVSVNSTPWQQPKSIDELVTSMHGMKSGQKVFYVAGHTSIGVYNDGPYDLYVDVKKIPDLHKKTIDMSNAIPTVTIGSGVSLTEVVDFFKSTSTQKGFKYLGIIAKHLRKIASVPVRNLGTWAGNLMIKNKHNEFPSDAFLCFELSQATLNIVNADNVRSNLTLSQLVKTNMDNPRQFIVSAQFPSYDDDKILFRSYKIMPRAQNAHALVNGGFRAEIDKSQPGKFIFKSPPALIFGNITKDFIHAEKTEAFLAKRDMGDPAVLQGALKTLKAEINPTPEPADASPAYRELLSCSLFYKFALEIVGKSADPRFQSAVGSLVDTRAISSGQQKFPTNPNEYPLTQPIPKLESMVQCTGEAKYIADDDAVGMCYATFVHSTQGNADIGQIDATEALKVPGVIRVITAMDIPGTNNFSPPQFTAEELLATKQSSFAGQPVGIVVATSRDAAEAGAKAVKVTYTNVKAPLLTCQDAIDAKSFFPPVNDLVIGDAAGAIKSAPHQVSGQLEIGGQWHFHMETQAAVCRPTEDGMNVEAGTQWVDSVQDGIAQVLGMAKNKLNVQVKRVGGSYGAKITRNNIIASGCALAAYLVNRPVKLQMSLWDNNRAIGKRFPYLTKYQAGFDNNGKLLGVILDVYGNIGSTANDSALSGELTWGDNTYNCANWKISMSNCKTNLPPNTWCRAPGSTEAIYFIEYVMEHIAKSLKLPSINVKQANFYKNGDKQITGQAISYCSIADVTTQLLQKAEFQKRLQGVTLFNKNNRWRKRGISVTPMKYGSVWNGNQYSCHVAVFHNGGTVAVSHGGVEIGQGLNTKVAQVVAHELGVALDQVAVKPNMSFTSANATSTGGSMTSELCCLAALDCCAQLKARMKPVKEAMKADTPWTDLVEKCYSQGIDLSARAWTAPATPDAPICYNTYGATCCEVETDILTGEYQINRYDVLYDCGESMSPFVDVGQIEGAVIMGLGYYTSEELKYDKDSGELLTFSTWTYKPPSTKDIPIDFRVEILQNAPNPLGVLRSKLVAEPPLCMTNSVVFALRNACNAALDETQKGNDWFQFDAPVTVERFQGSCQLDISQFTYK